MSFIIPQLGCGYNYGISSHVGVLVICGIRFYYGRLGPCQSFKDKGDFGNFAAVSDILVFRSYNKVFFKHSQHAVNVSCRIIDIFSGSYLYGVFSGVVIAVVDGGSGVRESVLIDQAGILECELRKIVAVNYLFVIGFYGNCFL